MGGNVRFGRGPKGAAGPAGPTGPAGDAYTKYTVTFQDFIDDGAVITLQNFPALTVIENAIMKTSIAFDRGGGNVLIRLYSAPNFNPEIELLQSFLVSSAVDGQNFAMSKYLYCGGLGNVEYNARLEIDVQEGAIGDLVAGSIDVWLKKSLLP